MTLPCAVRPERGALPPTLLRWASGRGQSPRAALPETPGRLLGEAACVLLLLGVVAWFFAPLVSGAAIVVERDALTAVLPVKLFLARALAAAEPPWWNPAPALGKPFLADPLPGALYPGNLLLLAGSFARAYDLFTVAHYAWTALGAFLLLRAARLPRAAALLGAVVWALGGALVSLANVVNHLSAAAWLPWVLWAWTRPRRHAAKVAAASLALAMPVLCGSPEMALLAAAALVLWSEDARSLLVPPLALGLAAAEVVPVFAYLRETWRGVHGFSADAAMRLSATPAQLVQLVRAGGPLEPETFLASVYVGLPVAGLALVGLLGASRRRAAVCAALGLGIAALALGPRTPLLPLLYAHLPFADLLRYPGKLLVALHGLIALGAAFGCARLLALVRGRGGGLGGSRAAAVLGGLLVVLVAVDLAEENRGLARGEPTDEVLTPPAAARAMLDDAARASEAAPGAAAGEPGSEPGDSDRIGVAGSPHALASGRRASVPNDR